MKIFLFERFDQNECFLMLCTLVVYLIFWRMPKRFPRSVRLLLCLWGFTVPIMYDFTFGGGLYDYYDINDSSRYCLFDLMTYIMYAPFGYFFAFFYERLGVGRRTTPLYLLTWAVVAVLYEWSGVYFKVFTYKHGYGIFGSFCIYLFTESMTLLYFNWIKKSSSS